MGCIMSTAIDEEDEEKKLMECTYKNTKKFTFAGKTFKAKCVKVYDGDTATVVIRVFGGYYKFNVRMDGYDTPELKPKKGTPEEKAEERKWGLRSRDVLANMILGKIVTINCKDYDKYGRILGEILLGTVNVNYAMIKDGYSRIYGGSAGLHKDDWDFSAFEKKWKASQKTKEKSTE